MLHVIVVELTLPLRQVWKATDHARFLALDLVLVLDHEKPALFDQNGTHLSLIFNEHFEADGAIVFREACKLGCEGIVSKGSDSLIVRGDRRIG